VPVWCQDEAGPYQAIPQAGASWQPEERPACQPHAYIRGGTAKLLTLFHPATGTVRVKGVTSAPNVVLHPWLQAELEDILKTLPPSPPPPLPADHPLLQYWRHWLGRPADAPLPPVRLILIWDNLVGHTSADLMRWLARHGILPLYTPLAGSWLNMAESVQRIIVRRALAGQEPATPDDLILDQNDADTLRADPLLKLVCGRRPESDADLASQPTLSRFENAVGRHACRALAHALLGVYLRARKRDGRPTHIVLDIDSTDDPTHGEQEGTAYHGYYRQHMYHPLLVFDGDTDQLVVALLRPGDAHASRGVRSVLRVLIRAMRARWPGVTIEIRADGGCAVPALYDFCEREDIGFTIGLIPNPRLQKIAAPLLAQAKEWRAATGEKTPSRERDTLSGGVLGAGAARRLQSRSPGPGTQHPLRRHHADRPARSPLRLVRGSGRGRTLDQGLQARLHR